MDNENRHNTDNGLSRENQRWLDDLVSNSEASLEASAAQLLKEQEAQAEAKAAAASQEDEIAEILATDWDNITLPKETKVQSTPVPRQNQPAPKTDPVHPAQSKGGRRLKKKPVEQKGRPEKKDGTGLWGIPHFLATGIWLILIVAIGISLGRVLWVCCADVMAFGKDNQKVTITITADDTIDTISKKLGQANLVRYPNLFKFFAKVTNKDDDIGVGTFTLNSQLDYNAMINAMYNSGAKIGIVDIMFPEGSNCAQMFKLLEEKGVCTVAELEAYAANGELREYWFLEGVPRGDRYCLEGYLAPDTYEFYTNDEPRRVLEKFLNEFDDRFTDKMKGDFETLQKNFADKLRSKGFSAAYIQQNTLTLHQVVTLASIIQKEAASDSECYDIASTFYNRLSNASILSLGADATVYYAIGDYFGETEELTVQDLNTDSPYNTRKNKGIPPGAICNMGVHALYAALEPNETNYHYFVYDKSKSAHRFAVTESEHNKNVAELMGD